MIRVLLIGLLTFGCVYAASAQAPAGEISGKVQDTARDYVLPSATVAVYRAADSLLLGFQLTVADGYFKLGKLPPGVPLKLVVTYMGYAPLIRRFTIDALQPALPMGTLNMQRAANNLAEVVVSVPPVQMKGDTLEFNADAFRLDSASVLEDLMRKLPGVTVWGDGLITVNGMAVKNILVDGKPFFGDPKIALQNLPKVGVGKVQVYSRAENPDNTRDSTLEMNVKLKKGFKRGLFGKLSAGAGTDNRFQGDGMISVYSPKTQISIVGAANNINIVPNSAKTMLENASFRAGALNISYPNFRMSGANQPNAGGVTWQHDFTEANPQREDRLTGNYFLRNDNSRLVRDKLSITSLPGSDQLLRENLRRSTYATRQDFSTRYGAVRQAYRMSVAASGQHANIAEHYDETSASESKTDGLQSLNRRRGAEDATNTGTQVELSFSAMPGMRVQKGYFPRTWNAAYAFKTHRNSRTGHNRSDFTASGAGGDNQLFNRDYRHVDEGSTHQLKFDAGDVTGWLLNKTFLRKIQTTLLNDLTISHTDRLRRVNDLDESDKVLDNNDYLSYSATERWIQESPSLRFSRSFIKSLHDRYQKSLSVDFTAGSQFTAQSNRSAHDFLNLTRRYAVFLPGAAIRFRHYSDGLHQVAYTLQYTETIHYPNSWDLARVTDSADAYSLQYGNPLLRESRQREVSLHSSKWYFDKRNMHYLISLSAGAVSRQHTDSVEWDQQGRRSIYIVNADGYRYVLGSSEFARTFKFRKNQLQLGIMGNGRIYQAPGYVNGRLNMVKGRSAGGNATATYTFGAWLLLSIRQDVNAQRTVQEVPANRVLRVLYTATTGNAGAKITDRMTLTSNLTYNYSKMAGTEGVHFTIWNAGAAYRFMKGKHLELSLSALDLLHQNTSIVNQAYSNTISQTRNNVLEQYFMCTVSWFPRKFGPAKK